MRFQHFVGPSYKLSSVNVDCQRTINLFPELNEMGTGKEGEVAALVSAPGLRLLATIGDGPHRGEYVTSNGRAFSVSGNKLFELDETFTATERGTLNTNVGAVSLADNGLQLMMVDGLNGYVLDLGTNVFSVIAEEGYTDRTPPTKVCYIDGYFTFIEPGTDNWFISGLDAVTFDPLDVSDADGSPDKLVSMIVNQREVWLMGEDTTEVWFNSGDSAFPFSRVSGAFVEMGCAAAFSVAKLGSAVYWLGRDKHGAIAVYAAEGYQPKKISTIAIDVEIQKYESISDATAYTYSMGGHSFYVLNFTSANTTWVFDISTGLWHERTYSIAGRLDRHRGSFHAFAHGKHIVGDYQSAKLYEMSPDVRTDDGAPIKRLRAAPHASSGGRRVWWNEFKLDIETGVGLDGFGQGTSPQIMLRYSDDGGSSWSNEKWTGLGKIGERRYRAIWRRLGQSRDRVFEISITDPVKITILGAEVDTTVGGA